MRSLKLLIIITRIGLGGLFLYAGVQKFIPKERTAKVQKEVVKEQNEKAEAKIILEHKAEKSPESRIGPFIGGLKQTGYFWVLLGVVEILCGLLLLSQVGALLGAVILVPITLNIFLFHLFLTPNDFGEIAMCALYLGANIFLIAYEYPKLKSVFLPFIKAKTI